MLWAQGGHQHKRGYDTPLCLLGLFISWTEEEFLLRFVLSSSRGRECGASGSGRWRTAPALHTCPGAALGAPQVRSVREGESQVESSSGWPGCLMTHHIGVQGTF